VPFPTTNRGSPSPPASNVEREFPPAPSRRATRAFEGLPFTCRLYLALCKFSLRPRRWLAAMELVRFYDTRSDAGVRCLSSSPFTKSPSLSFRYLALLPLHLDMLVSTFGLRRLTGGEIPPVPSHDVSSCFLLHLRLSRCLGDCPPPRRALDLTSATPFPPVPLPLFLPPRFFFFWGSPWIFRAFVLFSVAVVC